MAGRPVPGALNIGDGGGKEEGRPSLWEKLQPLVGEFHCFISDIG
jgi:hypothetical protein